ncbi:unnamed protein product [Rhodiola kirilowii]
MLRPWEQHCNVIIILASTTTRPPLSSIILTLASSSPAPSRGRKAQLKKPCPSLKSTLGP